MTINYPNEAAIAMGFEEIKPVSTLLSIAHLFGISKRRCGIYLLVFPSELFYIGQAIDVVRRFSQHRRNYDDIIGFSFIQISKVELNEVEKKLIFNAGKLGFKLKNAVHVSSLLGDADFDLLMPLAEQQAWLSVTSALDDANELNPKIFLPESQLARFSKNFEQFINHPLSQQATALLGRYIRACLPAPRRTEYSFWSVSCMPSTNKNTWPRLFCVNAASMELFVVGWDKNSNLLWSFLTVDEEVLIEYWPDPDEFLMQFPSVEFLSAEYRDAGQNQITLRCSKYAQMRLLLLDKGVCKAAAALNLRVMRKRANFYMQYHCAALVNKALSDVSSLDMTPC
ncbi:MAG: GIY-YIG nuclease family protein [Sideroxydans sp.]|nr:GIY-YIG nuclease family protein [Sideroxydans sp.]